MLFVFLGGENELVQGQTAHALLRDGIDCERSIAMDRNLPSVR